MKSIVFIGTQKSGSSREAIKAALELGYFTVLLTDRTKQMNQRNEYKDVHLMEYCDLKDIDELERKIQKLEVKGLDVKGIVSFVDSYVHTACQLGDIFGVNHFTTEAILSMENKVKSREALKESSYIPQFRVLEPETNYKEEDIKEYLPAILKSPQSTGSKDVYKVNNYEEFTKAYKDLKGKSKDGKLLVEEYLEGPQYLIEALVIRGRVYIIGVVEQEISYLNDHFIVTGYHLLIDAPSFYPELRKAVYDIIYLHGLKNGACHLELRNVGGNWKLVEINPRISGGGMNQLILAGYGVNLVKETLKLSLNQLPNINIRAHYRKEACIQYTTISKEGTIERVTGKRRAMRKKGVLKVYIKPRKGNSVGKPISMGNRYAYVLATGDSKDEAVNNAKTAINEIKFHVIEND